MNHKSASGYEEIEHTADLSIKVWAPTIEDLFMTALSGMYTILGVSTINANRIGLEEFQFSEMDHESLLVSLLSECNYRIHYESIYQNIIDITVEPQSINGQFSLYEISDKIKEIKAVTYHNLKIQHSPKGFSVVIVFDV